MPFVKGKSGNPDGRPVGARNKVNAERELNTAMASGMSLKQIVNLLSDRVQDEKISQVQRDKYLTELIKLKMFLATQEIKISEEQKKVDRLRTPKELPREDPKGEVKSFPRPIIKRG